MYRQNDAFEIVVKKNRKEIETDDYWGDVKTVDTPKARSKVVLFEYYFKNAGPSQVLRRSGVKD